MPYFPTPKGGANAWARSTQTPPATDGVTGVLGRAKGPRPIDGCAARAHREATCGDISTIGRTRRNLVDWGLAYLAALEISAHKGEVAERSRVTLRTVQRRRNADAAFAAAERDALEVAEDLIEDEIMRRAIEGVEEPVFGSGGKGVGTVQVGTICRFSDTLLLRLAERVDPSWRQKQPIQTASPMAFATRADRKKALEEARKANAAPLG